MVAGKFAPSPQPGYSAGRSPRAVPHSSAIIDGARRRNSSLPAGRSSMSTKKTSSAPTRSPRKGRHFHTCYRHWRTGKMMYAADYGYKAWPF